MRIVRGEANAPEELPLRCFNMTKFFIEVDASVQPSIYGSREKGFAPFDLHLRRLLTLLKGPPQLPVPPDIHRDSI